MEQQTQPPFLNRIFRRPPILFPFVLLFHIVVLIFLALPVIRNQELQNLQGFLSIGWGIIYLVLWLFICDMRKFAATAYMIFAAINLLLQFALKHDPLWHEVGISLFPFDVLMTVFLLFYYKRFH